MISFGFSILLEQTFWSNHFWQNYRRDTFRWNNSIADIIIQTCSAGKIVVIIVNSQQWAGFYMTQLSKVFDLLKICYPSTQWHFFHAQLHILYQKLFVLAGNDFIAFRKLFEQKFIFQLKYLWKIFGDTFLWNNWIADIFQECSVGKIVVKILSCQQWWVGFYMTW